MYMYVYMCSPLTVWKDIGALQKEVGALEELNRQLFVEYVEMLNIKVCHMRLSA